MHLALATLFLIVTFFSACSTISKNQSAHILKLLPPPIDLDSQQSPEQAEATLIPLLSPDKDQSLKWWARYQLGRVWAKADANKSCGFFTQVSSEPGSPLAHLALLRSLEVCPATHKIDTVKSFEQIKEPWLIAAAAAAGHKRALATRNESEELYFTPHMIRESKLQSEKVKLLRRAIEISKKQNQKDKVSELETQLYSLAPRLEPIIKEENFARAAADFRTNRQFAKAREYYSKIIAEPKSTDLEKYRALDGIRLSYKLEERTNEYLRATSNMAKFAGFRFKNKATRRDWVGKYHDAQVLLARTVWTKRSSVEARKIILNTQKTLADYPQTETYWLLARIAEENGKFEEAVTLLEKIDLSQSRDSEFKQRVLWYKAWNLRRGPRWQQAVTDMQTILTDSTNSAFIAARTRYWLGRTLKEHDLKDEAKKEFEQVVEEDPLGYYGIVAARELELPFHALPQSDASDESQFVKNEAFTNANDGVYFEWLAATGEHEVAQEFLEFLYSTYQSEGRLKKNTLVDFLRMYPRVGGYKALFIRINELTPEVRNELVKKHSSLLFPMPFKKVVEDASLQFGVEPEFVYSIMRQESAFDPHARSHADAFGLLQLIPKAAKYAQERIPKTAQNVKFNEPEDLYQPEVNIPLGAVFIADTMKRYNGQLMLTAAAYNASEEAIKGWQKTRYRNDPTEFIEDIPYEETRTYLKLVLRNYLFYKRLNLREPTMSFPERCLAGMQGAKP